MSKGSSPVKKPEFSRLVALSALKPREEMRLAANEAERAALMKRFNLAALESLEAALTPSEWRGAGWRVDGRLEAQGAQRCVVTLEPAPFKMREHITRGFLPARMIQDPKGAEEELALDAELDDAVEPLSGSIDFGEIVAEAFGLALDPYPRLEGAEAPPVETEKEDNPFKALEALKGKLNGKAE